MKKLMAFLILSCSTIVYSQSKIGVDSHKTNQNGYDNSIMLPSDIIQRQHNIGQTMIYLDTIGNIVKINSIAHLVLVDSLDSRSIIRRYYIDMPFIIVNRSFVDSRDTLLVASEFTTANGEVAVTSSKVNDSVGKYFMNPIKFEFKSDNVGLYLAKADTGEIVYLCKFYGDSLIMEADTEKMTWMLIHNDNVNKFSVYRNILGSINHPFYVGDYIINGVKSKTAMCDLYLLLKYKYWKYLVD